MLLTRTAGVVTATPSADTPCRLPCLGFPTTSRIRRAAASSGGLLSAEHLRTRLKAIRRAGGDPCEYLLLLERKLAETRVRGRPCRRRPNAPRAADRARSEAPAPAKIPLRQSATCGNYTMEGDPRAEALPNALAVGTLLTTTETTPWHSSDPTASTPTTTRP
jgi:hypothetical protein